MSELTASESLSILVLASMLGNFISSMLIIGFFMAIDHGKKED